MLYCQAERDHAAASFVGVFSRFPDAKTANGSEQRRLCCRGSVASSAVHQLASSLENETMHPHAVNHTIVQQLRAAFDHAGADLVCAYLYGSLARGQEHRDSDVDIGVLYATEPPLTLDGPGGALGTALERHLGRPVDLVVLNRAPVDLIHRILRGGILLHDRDPAAHIRFEVQARNAYFDLLPYLRQYRRTTRDASP